MAIELKMPALSPTMEKGTLAKWLVNEGDIIKAGDLIAEIETDKATMEFEAVDEGRIARLIVPEGSDDIAVGTVIALMAEEGEAASEPMPGASIATRTGPVAEALSPEIASDSHSTPDESPLPVQISAFGKLEVSPLARRIAEAKGIDLNHINGTGAHGRIVRADLGLDAVERLSSAAAAPGVGAASAHVIAPPPAGVPLETVKLGSMRKTIARRLTEAKQTVPHFYLTARCNLDALLRLRGELNVDLAGRGVKLSVNDMLMKAMALALIEVPDANVQFGGEELHRFTRVDIAMAVAIDDGLITPVIRDVGTLSLSAIAGASKTLAAKARDGGLLPEDYQGGTASISNLGMFGIDEMFPIINPPQALILGIGSGVEQPRKVDGQIGLATIMAATASFDHRAIDGAVAAQFMAAFRYFVERPLVLVS